MARLAVWLVVALVLCAAGFVVATSGMLPPRVATHFGRGGVPNGWMTRDAYTIFALGFATLVPLFVLGAVGWLPQRFPQLASLPHRAFWMAPQRLAATLTWLRGFGAALAIATAVFAIGTHGLILEANARTPARLDEPWFIALLAAFVIAIAIGAIVMSMKFRRVPG